MIQRPLHSSTSAVVSGTVRISGSRNQRLWRRAAGSRPPTCNRNRRIISSRTKRLICNYNLCSYNFLSRTPSKTCFNLLWIQCRRKKISWLASSLSLNRSQNQSQLTKIIWEIFRLLQPSIRRSRSSASFWANLTTSPSATKSLMNWRRISSSLTKLWTIKD